VQALYIQNFETGMNDFALSLLTAMLKNNKHLWALNVGENFKITNQGWEKFAIDLRHTNITHLYAGSESTVYGDLKKKMRDAIRDNRCKHKCHTSMENYQVIAQIGQMWWNPRNSVHVKEKKHGFTPIKEGELVAWRHNKGGMRVGLIEKTNEMKRLVSVFGGQGEALWLDLQEEEGVTREYFLGFAFHSSNQCWWPLLLFESLSLGLFVYPPGKGGGEMDLEDYGCFFHVDYLLSFDNENIARFGNDLNGEAIAFCDKEFFL
jgi:hypothetical protein